MKTLARGTMFPNTFVACSGIPGNKIRIISIPNLITRKDHPASSLPHSLTLYLFCWSLTFLNTKLDVKTQMRWQKDGRKDEIAKGQQTHNKRMAKFDDLSCLFSIRIPLRSNLTILLSSRLGFHLRLFNIAHFHNILSSIQINKFP